MAYLFGVIHEWILLLSILYKTSHQIVNFSWHVKCMFDSLKSFSMWNSFYSPIFHINRFPKYLNTKDSSSCSAFHRKTLCSMSLPHSFYRISQSVVQNRLVFILSAYQIRQLISCREWQPYWQKYFFFIFLSSKLLLVY